LLVGTRSRFQFSVLSFRLGSRGLLAAGRRAQPIHRRGHVAGHVRPEV